MVFRIAVPNCRYVNVIFTSMCTELTLTDEQLQNYVLVDIDAVLQSNNRSLKDFPMMPQPDSSVSSEIPNRLIYDELNYDREVLAREHIQLLSSMTDQTRRVYFLSMGLVDQGRHIFGEHCLRDYDLKEKLY